MLEIAKKYILVNPKPEELAKKLTVLKAAGGSAYADMIEVLDATLDTIEKSGAFGEIGKRGASNTDDAWSKIETAATEIQKAKPDIKRADAIMEACAKHPELVDEYQKGRS